MTTQWQITMKPVFLHGVTALAVKELHQVMAKVDMLVQDPLPDGKVKKQLTHLAGKPYRIRSGNYRIIYTLEKQNVSVLKLEKRREDTSLAVPAEPMRSSQPLGSVFRKVLVDRAALKQLT